MNQEEELGKEYRVFYCEHVEETCYYMHMEFPRGRVHRG
jgi:phage-related protein